MSWVGKKKDEEVADDDLELTYVLDPLCLFEKLFDLRQVNVVGNRGEDGPIVGLQFSVDGVPSCAVVGITESAGPNGVPHLAIFK